MIGNRDEEHTTQNRKASFELQDEGRKILAHCSNDPLHGLLLYKSERGFTAAQIGGVLKPIGAGVQLTSQTPVYDCGNERMITGSESGSLVILENAVVVPGSRGVAGEFVLAHSLALTAPLIIKYLDELTDARTALEEVLR